MSLQEFFEKYWVFLASGVIFPTFWYALKATFAHKNDLDIERRRITLLESKLDALPNAKEFGSLNEKMAGISADMAWLKTNVDLLVQTEMKRKKE